MCCVNKTNLYALKRLGRARNRRDSRTWLATKLKTSQGYPYRVQAISMQFPLNPKSPLLHTFGRARQGKAQAQASKQAKWYVQSVPTYFVARANFQSATSWHFFFRDQVSFLLFQPHIRTRTRDNHQSGYLFFCFLPVTTHEDPI